MHNHLRDDVTARSPHLIQVSVFALARLFARLTRPRIRPRPLGAHHARSTGGSVSSARTPPMVDAPRCDKRLHNHTEYGGQRPHAEQDTAPAGRRCRVRFHINELTKNKMVICIFRFELLLVFVCFTHPRKRFQTMHEKVYRRHNHGGADDT